MRDRYKESSVFTNTPTLGGIMSLKVRSILSTLIFITGLIGGVVQADTLPLPLNQTFTETTGITWLHLGGKPMARRYEITPGPNHKCTFEAYKYYCNARPCEGEESLQIKISYYDPSMNEEGGVIHNYLSLAWKDVENMNPFKPRDSWRSVSSGGRNITQVSYIPNENATLLFEENSFMISSYTWMKIITNDTYDKIESIRLSHDLNENNKEMDRWTVLDCQEQE